MIIYNKTLWGVPLLTRVYGSAVPRSLVPAVVSGLFTLLMLLLGERVQHLWEHPFAYQPFVLIVSFVLTFRSNYAYQRHWEAYTQFQSMSSRWLDAAVQIIMFDKHPQAAEPGPSKEHSSRSAAVAAAAGHHQFVAELIHAISLLHGTCCAALRRDPQLRNLTRHCRSAEAPPLDPALITRDSLPGSPGAPRSPRSPRSPAAAAAAGGGSSSFGGSAPGGGFGRWATSTSRPLFLSNVDIIGAANWRDIFMLRGSSSNIRKYNAAQPLAVIGGVSPQEVAALGCKGRCEEDDCSPEGLDSDDDSYHYHAQRPQVLGMSTAYRNGATRSHSIWSMLRHRQQQQQQPPEQQQGQQQKGLGAVRSRSYSEGLNNIGQPPALATTSGSASRFSLSNYFDVGRTSSRGIAMRSQAYTPRKRDSPALGPIGVSKEKRGFSRRFRTSLNHTCCPAHLPYMDRPFLLLSWVYELLLQRQAAGGLKVPAPVLARAYQCLSDGIHAYEQCRKLADTPFPFPWAQFVLIMLVLFTFTLPILMLAYIKDTALAVVLTVVTVSTYWTVNEVARDVEDAFIMEPNNMPVANSQYHFNELLLTLSVAHRPACGVVPVVLGMPQHRATAAAATAGIGTMPHIMTRTGTAPPAVSFASARPQPPAEVTGAASAAAAAAMHAPAGASEGADATVTAPAHEGASCCSARSSVELGPRMVRSSGEHQQQQQQYKAPPALKLNLSSISTILELPVIGSMADRISSNAAPHAASSAYHDDAGPAQPGAAGGAAEDAQRRSSNDARPHAGTHSSAPAASKVNNADIPAVPPSCSMQGRMGSDAAPHQRQQPQHAQGPKTSCDGLSPHIAPAGGAAVGGSATVKDVCAAGAKASGGASVVHDAEVHLAMHDGDVAEHVDDRYSARDYVTDTQNILQANSALKGVVGSGGSSSTADDMV